MWVKCRIQAHTFTAKHRCQTVDRRTHIHDERYLYTASQSSALSVLLCCCAQKQAFPIQFSTFFYFSFEIKRTRTFSLALNVPIDTTRSLSQRLIQSRHFAYFIFKPKQNERRKRQLTIVWCVLCVCEWVQYKNKEDKRVGCVQTKREHMSEKTIKTHLSVRRRRCSKTVNTKQLNSDC